MYKSGSNPEKLSIIVVTVEITEKRNRSRGKRGGSKNVWGYSSVMLNRPLL